MGEMMQQMRYKAIQLYWNWHGVNLNTSDNKNLIEFTSDFGTGIGCKDLKISKLKTAKTFYQHVLNITLRLLTVPSHSKFDKKSDDLLSIFTFFHHRFTLQLVCWKISNGYKFNYWVFWSHSYFADGKTFPTLGTADVSKSSLALFSRPFDFFLQTLDICEQNHRCCPGVFEKHLDISKYTDSLCNIETCGYHCLR